MTDDRGELLFEDPDLTPFGRYADDLESKWTIRKAMLDPQGLENAGGTAWTRRKQAFEAIERTLGFVTTIAAHPVFSPWNLRRFDFPELSKRANVLDWIYEAGDSFEKIPQSVRDLDCVQDSPALWAEAFLLHEWAFVKMLTAGLPSTKRFQATWNGAGAYPRLGPIGTGLTPHGGLVEFPLARIKIHSRLAANLPGDKPGAPMLGMRLLPTWSHGDPLLAIGRHHRVLNPRRIR